MIARAMKFCDACGRVVEPESDPGDGFCMREKCVARRNGVAPQYDPLENIRVSGPKRQRMRGARNKRKTRMAEPKFLTDQKRELPALQMPGSLLGSHLDETTLQGLLELKERLEAE